ncbi:MAG TPA: M20/M25/M40 family metallo-hydrolase, partial [Myxococcota bacterium]|nr:M20/M25/M40 family metallo-hydrolase [Myxococcota bacterium]
HRAWMTPAQIFELSRRAHDAGHCGGFIDVTDDDPAWWSAEPRRETFVDRPLQQAATVGAMLRGLSSERLAAHVRKLSSFHNRYYKSEDGVAAAQWIHDTWSAMARGHTDVQVELFNHRFAQPSVIARIPGTGPHRDEKVILGAHEDSVNMQFIIPTRRGHAPGADDNASGMAVLLETFAALMAHDFHPDRTVELIAYAGEELGLLGSRDIARSYKRSGQRVAAVLQLDMTMFPGRGRTLTLITDNVSRALTTFTERLVDTYVQAPWQESRCGYGCSDHASWDDAGYPAVFPFESEFRDSNPAIHTSRDTYDNGLDAAFAVDFAKLAVAFAVELGG